MKNLASELNFGAAEGTLKRTSDSNVSVIGRLLPNLVGSGSNQAATRNNNNNINNISINNNNNNNNNNSSDGDEEENNLLVHQLDGAAEGHSLLLKGKDRPPLLDPHYFYSVGHRRRPTWPDKVDGKTSLATTTRLTLCKTCSNKEDGIQFNHNHPGYPLNTSSTSLEVTQNIKSLLNGDDLGLKLCVSNGHSDVARIAEHFDGVQFSKRTSSPRGMVRSVSLGVDLPTKIEIADVGDTDTLEAGVYLNGSSSDGACRCLAGQRCRSKVVPNTAGTGAADLASTIPASLSAVLEVIPLAYDPQTKRLHIISPKPENSCLITNDHFDDADEDAVTGHRPTLASSSSMMLDNVESPSKCGLLESSSPSTPMIRVNTSGSLPSRAECSSYSSVSSLSTEFSSTQEDVLVASALALGVMSNATDCERRSEEPSFIEINLDRRRRSYDNRSSEASSENAGDADSSTVTMDDGSQGGAKPKRRGITGFLSRNLLPWKLVTATTTTRPANNSSDDNEHDPDDDIHRLPRHQTTNNWKFFISRSKDPSKLAEEYHLVNNYNSLPQSNASSPQRTQARRNGSSDSLSSTSSTPRRRRGDNLGVTSTTALILENRPLNLPAKAPEEELKHRLEYEQMVEDAKRRELKEVKLKKKHLQQQLKHEEKLSFASKIWNVEILNNWDSMRSSRKARELWWQGIPPNVRGKVWMLAIGNDLHITPELYEICVCRAKDRIRMAAESISVSEEVDVEAIADKEGSVELIKLDVSRTFPQLCIFQKGGPYYDLLHSLLGAYVCYRPDVGYVQGMSFLAAVLILNLDVADAFVCFANLLNQPCQLAFFRLDEPMMRSYFYTYEEFFRENMPDLFSHFFTQNLSPDLYLIDWIYTLYSRSLPLDVASRVWDVFFRDGDEFLFRTALGILHLYKDLLMRLDFIHVAQFLTKLPEDMTSEPLFRSIESIRMVSEKRTFAQVLAGQSDPKQN